MGSGLIPELEGGNRKSLSRRRLTFKHNEPKQKSEENESESIPVPIKLLNSHKQKSVPSKELATVTTRAPIERLTFGQETSDNASTFRNAAEGPERNSDKSASRQSKRLGCGSRKSQGTVGSLTTFTGSSSNSYSERGSVISCGPGSSTTLRKTSIILKQSFTTLV